MRWIALIFWIAVCFGVAALGGRWTAAEIPGWYETLVRPAFAPPNWVFGPVWSVLYLLMALAAWRVGLAAASPERTWGLALFLVQLALNLAWSWLFFHEHFIGLAAMEIFLLWAAIGAATLAFGRVAPAAALLMTPYWAWVTFAAALNAAFWLLN